MSEAGPKAKLSVLRWIAAIIGALIMIFAGGCAIIYAGIMVPMTLAAGGDETIGALFLVLIFGVIPFSIGFLLWWLAVKSGR